MRIKIKEALDAYNERKGTNVTLAEFALRVYKGQRMKKNSKVQRISHIQNAKSNYHVSLREALRLAQELDIDMNELNEKYIDDGTRKHQDQKLLAQEAN